MFNWYKRWLRKRQELHLKEYQEKALAYLDKGCSKLEHSSRGNKDGNRSKHK